MSPIHLSQSTLFVSTALLLVGCPSPPAANGPAAASTGDDVSTVTIPSAVPSAGAMSAGTTASSPPPAPVASAAADRQPFEAAYCTSHAHCSWDNPCVATRCQGKPGGAPIKCSESRPPPGDCGCYGNWCALKPNATHRATTAVQRCNSHEQCAVDVETATCVAVKNAREVLQIGPIEREGPYCDCVANKCEHRWQEPLKCSSDAQCWWERKGGRLKPARPDKPRKLPFRPCHDGEIDGVCHNGSCTVRSWKC